MTGHFTSYKTWPNHELATHDSRQGLILQSHPDKCSERRDPHEYVSSGHYQK
jgi:hypothetical protein